MNIATITFALPLLLASGLASAETEVYSCRLTRAVAGQIEKDIFPIVHWTFTVTTNPAAVTSPPADHFRDAVITAGTVRFTDRYGAQYRINRTTGALRIVPQEGATSHIEGRCKLNEGKH